MDSNSIKALEGSESLLLIFPKGVAYKLNITNQEWLTFEVKNRELVIRKIKNENETSQAGLRGAEL